MLTEKQQEVLDFIEGCISRTGRSPTYREMMEELDISSPSHVFRMIERLVDRGFVRRLPGRARAIEVIKPQTHLNPEYQRGLEEGLRLQQARGEEDETLAMAS